MKRMTTCIFTFLVTISGFAQNAFIHLTDTKTTSLIFPFPVKYVDRGSKDILVQQVKEAGNILLAKASSPQLKESNLTVITGAGIVYAFKVNYEADPDTLVWNIREQQEASVATYANHILDNPRTVRGIHNTKFGMYVGVSGIYIRGATIFYQLQFHNGTNIDYDIDHLRFSIRDSRKAKRTAMQELELTPLYIAGNTSLVKAGSNSSLVVALSKFTIPDAKFLAVAIGERNGGRHLFMKVHNRSIIKAIVLPDLR